MLWSRYTLLCTLAAALGGSSGVGASAHWEKRQDSIKSESASATTKLPTAAATTDNPATSSHTSGAAQTATATPTTPKSVPETGVATSTQAVPSPEPTDSHVEACHDKNSPSYPFCKPSNGQEVYIGDSYFVTWDVDAFKINSTVQIVLNYVNTTKNEGQVAFTSDRIPNKIGFITIKMDQAWLRDEPRNNLTFLLVNYDLATNDHSTRKTGPTISLTRVPVQHYPPPPPSKPNKLGLMVGLPVALVVVFVISCGLCIGMKKERRIGLGNIMGRRSKGYSGAKSRIERLGGRGRRRDRSIRMDDLEDPDRYTDDPLAHEREDMDRFNEIERSQGNAFRTELAKMKTWR
ncbi:hypothetical protein PRK78_006352 [Emydomyces testavorans]|uniref:Mid2 domain-containing protein n=1 Tax=Emydomyces testavorans TaxID=2070801 RepID=A0AAF0DL73_9EURO|nr:hypothetical protein PRK78_006352 [Emydomyces testavorans]